MVVAADDRSVALADLRLSGTSGHVAYLSDARMFRWRANVIGLWRPSMAGIRKFRRQRALAIAQQHVADTEHVDGRCQRFDNALGRAPYIRFERAGRKYVGVVARAGDQQDLAAGTHNGVVGVGNGWQRPVWTSGRRRWWRAAGACTADRYWPLPSTRLTVLCWWTVRWCVCCGRGRWSRRPPAGRYTSAGGAAALRGSWMAWPRRPEAAVEAAAEATDRAAAEAAAAGGKCEQYHAGNRQAETDGMCRAYLCHTFRNE